MFRQRLFRLIIAAVVCALGWAVVYAQDGPLLEQGLTPTPARVIIPTSVPPPTAGQPPTPTATFTPQPEGPVQLEARQEAGPVNVRAQPDPNSDRLGSIQFGETYVVLGRYYRWLQIRFEPSPSRVAYVFEELVNIVGDESQIVDLTQQQVPTEDISDIEPTLTWEALQLTPGAQETLRAESEREIVAPGADGRQMAAPGEAGEQRSFGVLPTFTYPPNIVAQAPTQAPVMDVTSTPDPARLNLNVSDGVAPILPIVLLGAIGMIGILLSLLRR